MEKVPDTFILSLIWLLVCFEIELRPLCCSSLLFSNLIVSAYLDFAELQAHGRKPMYMADWIRKLDDFIRLTDREILTHAGKISHDAAQAKAEAEFAKFRTAQAALLQPVDRHFEQTLGELEKLEGESKALPEPKFGEAKKKPGRRKKSSE